MVKEKARRKAPLLLAVTLLLVGAAAIVLPVVLTDAEIAQDAEEYAELRKNAGEIASEPSVDATAEPISEPETAPYPFSVALIPTNENRTGVDVATCQAINSDFVAWLQIPGTTVDYPVVQSDDTDYYLHHTFTGKKSYIGTLFSLEKTDYATPGRNIAIYGHHIRSNDVVMFSPLIAYKEQSFYAGHDTVYLDSLYHSSAYTIFAVINMRVGDWEPSTPDFSTDADFLRFVAQARVQSLYETGVEVTAGDEILTLITCDRAYIPKEGRLIVMAVKKQ